MGKSVTYYVSREKSAMLKVSRRWVGLANMRSSSLRSPSSAKGGQSLIFKVPVSDKKGQRTTLRAALPNLNVLALLNAEEAQFALIIHRSPHHIIRQQRTAVVNDG